MYPKKEDVLTVRIKGLSAFIEFLGYQNAHRDIHKRKDSAGRYRGGFVYAVRPIQNEVKSTNK